MPRIAECLVDAERVGPALQEAREKLDSADGELLLDFSAVRRLDVSALRALEQLAIAAEDRAAKIWLCGVNVEVYRVLKLVKLGPRFSFLTEDNGRASSCRN